MPELYGPPRTRLTFFSKHTGINSAKLDWSSSVYRPASRKQSKSPSRANRASISHWFIPTPMAFTTP